MPHEPDAVSAIFGVSLGKAPNLSVPQFCSLVMITVLGVVTAVSSYSKKRLGVVGREMCVGQNSSGRSARDPCLILHPIGSFHPPGTSLQGLQCPLQKCPMWAPGMYTVHRYTYTRTSKELDF